MIVVCLSWIYLFIVCILIGLLVRNALRAVFHLDYPPAMMEVLIIGVTALTVYAEYFSIVHRVGIVAHVVMLLVCAISFVLNKKQLSLLFQNAKKALCFDDTARYRSGEIVLYILLILAVAFFTSRGDFHTDTKLYHAQAIRQIEEYGLIKGQGNLQMQFAYNSAYFPFAALFTFSWLVSVFHAIHTTTGFFFVIMIIYSLFGLLRIRQSQSHKADMIRVAILLYALTNLYYAQSPASDYPAMLLTMYLMCAWLDADGNNAPVERYGMLSVLVMCIISVKLSAAALIILAVYPAIRLLRGKEYQKTGLFLLAGFLVFLPFLIRNYYVSGYLLYPQTSIDLFRVEWKVPMEIVERDLGIMRTYAQGLIQMQGQYSPDLGAWSVRQWLPIWWAYQDYYEQRLIYAFLTGSVLVVVNFIRKRIRGGSFDPSLAIIFVTCYASFVLWFLSAPFIRYGLSFLFAVPLIAIGDAWDIAGAESRKSRTEGGVADDSGGVVRYLAGGIVVVTVMCFAAWTDHYMMDCLVFLKHHVREPYYLIQNAFPQNEHDELLLTSPDGETHTIYYGVGGENSGYMKCPATAGVAGELEMMGNHIRDGLKIRNAVNE